MEFIGFPQFPRDARGEHRAQPGLKMRGVKQGEREEERWRETKLLGASVWWIHSLSRPVLWHAAVVWKGG